MLIFKVMVCFLALFRSEDCVGGLPTIEDSPDNDRAGQSARSASNQGVTNEPVIRPGDLPDYAVRHGADITGKVNPEAEAEAEVSPDEISTPCIPPGEERAKFLSGTPSDNVKTLREEFREGYSGTDQCKPFLDKSKSRKDLRTTETEPQDPSPASQGSGEEAHRFSSVLEEKVEENKDEFESDSSAHLTISQISSDGEDERRKNPASLLSEGTSVPGPEEDSITRSRTSRDELPVENRQRKSLGDVTTWQQSTNMRPTRTQYLVQNKRSTGEGSLKLPGYGGPRNLARHARVQEPIRRHYDTDRDGPAPQLQFAALNPAQINAAVAYSSRPPHQQALNLDLSRALYQFGPAQLHALKGVFDKVPPSTQNFKPIAPKQVAYVPPRIVYETKIVPTPFMQFRTEQKTVDALSALLGQNPAQQLQGLKLILRKDGPEVPRTTPTPAIISTPGISRQGLHGPEAQGQAFVTPVPSVDINSELGDGSFRFSNDGSDPNEEIRPVIESPFDQKTPGYPRRENDDHGRNEFETIPIVEKQEEAPSSQREEELHPGWDGETGGETRETNEGRYRHHNQESNHGEAYAAKYNFGYHVKDYDSGNNFGHEEARDGVITNGRYHVLLPDGRIQNVKYHVDEGGYHAKVSYQLQNHQL